MKLNELKSLLRVNPTAAPRFILPDGDQIPAHFHVTEVGHVAKNFVDCGGTFRQSEACVLQTYVANDFEHRLTAGRLAEILELGRSVLPHDDFEVEVEWDCCVISQYPIASAEAEDDHLNFTLTTKHTDCLAKDKCGIGEDSCGCGNDTAAMITTTAATSCC
ncbi:MAG TPA: DUF6428 family protein [Chthoniobacterales bacterium]|nr:DUF6428 family protein [Chthoniobacterales bacterium]